MLIYIADRGEVVVGHERRSEVGPRHKALELQSHILAFGHSELDDDALVSCLDPTDVGMDALLASMARRHLCAVHLIRHK